jgi:hypothetical protein
MDFFIADAFGENRILYSPNMPPTATAGDETLRYKTMDEKKRPVSPPAVFVSFSFLRN